MKLFLCCLLIAIPAHAEPYIDIPFVKEDPVTDQKFTTEAFEKFFKILKSSKLGPHLDCELKAEFRHELRKYSDRETFVDLIEVEFETDAGFARGDVFKVKFPISSTYGRKFTPNHWSGQGEEFMIRSNDYYSHWLRFIHDGRGQIVLIMVGNNLRTYPCRVKE